MQSSYNPRSVNTADAVFFPDAGVIDAGQVNQQEVSTQVASDPIQFHGSYIGSMEMNADPDTVAKYLDVHQDWFHRCAHPMAVDAIATNGYAITIGRYGSFGYEVEPKVGLHLLPQDQGVYRIQTIPVPGYEPPGYDVDFQAALQLKEGTPEPTTGIEVTTHVEWDLDLKVYIKFPRFIRALPMSLIQSTGDKLLNQVVRQVSRRLTYKVQEDFHSTRGLPLPKSAKKR